MADEPIDAGTTEGGAEDAATPPVEDAAAPQADDAATPQNETTVTPEVTTPPAKKPRSPIERAVVWGLIVVLLIVVILEGRARMQHSQAISKLSQAIQKSETDGHDCLLTDAEAIMAGATTISAPNQEMYEVHMYQWKGLFKTYSIRLQTTAGPDSIILAMDTNPDPTAPIGPLHDPAYRPKGTPIAADGEEAEEEDHAEAAGSESGERGGEGGRRQRRSFADMDANGDGKITADEVSERMAERFDSIDANGDGGIDEDELNAARERFMNARGSRPDEAEEKAEEKAEETESKAAEPAEKPAEATPEEKPAATEPEKTTETPAKETVAPAGDDEGAPDAGDAKPADANEKPADTK